MVVTSYLLPLQWPHRLQQWRFVGGAKSRQYYYCILYICYYVGNNEFYMQESVKKLIFKILGEVANLLGKS